MTRQAPSLEKLAYISQQLVLSYALAWIIFLNLQLYKYKKKTTCNIHA